MPQALADDLKALVREANFAHLATLMRDGSPQVAPAGSISMAISSWSAPARAR
jgi:Pyridoxamine 5'-phosphate oxidase